MTVEVLHADCRDALARMEANSIHAVVTDPPYGLSKEPDAAEVLRHWLAGDDYEHTGAGFMGKSWDSFVPGPSIWREVFRVMKPGAHLLCFAGTRTQDLMGIALRLAGFEIRDCIRYEQGREAWPGWITGQGFPKSTDVSKSIDKAAGAEREVVGVDLAKASRQTRKVGTTAYGDFSGNSGEVTAPATEAARQWEGWHSAMKPAWEPILVARKPLSEPTIAANVLAHGTGAINVGACRVPSEPRKICNYESTGPQGCITHTGVAGHSGREYSARIETAGRFPANVIHDNSDEVLQAFAAFGTSKTAGTYVRGARAEGEWLHAKEAGTVQLGYGDTGTAARFFQSCPPDAETLRFHYSPKANKRDRAGSKHVTVKPQSLLRYLSRLICPPGGTILDPFAGSGSLAPAAHAEGFNAVLIEREAEYVADIHRRVAALKHDLLAAD